MKDVIEDIEQFYGVGEQSQYKEAASVVRAVREAADGPIVILGHSLGAGQAQYALAMNADVGHMRGVGFNAAGLSAERISDAELRVGGSSVAAAVRECSNGQRSGFVGGDIVRQCGHC